MYLCLYVCMHTYMYQCKDICCMHIDIFVSRHKCINFVYMCVCMHICMYVCV